MRSAHDLYQAILGQICAGIEKGEACWWNETAQQGPAILERSGFVLRGLPALIAWHVGDTSGKRALVWRLVPDCLDDARCAVFLLPSNGGASLYAGIPGARAKRVESESASEMLSLGELHAILKDLVEGLGDVAPNLTGDLDAIASMAQAFLRPLGDSSPPERIGLGRGWTPARLARVASWARLVADEAGFRSSGWIRWGMRPPGRWCRSGLDWGAYAPGFVARPRPTLLGSVVSSAWFLECLPAELREPVAAGQRHEVPNQRFRQGLLDGAVARRAPAIGSLAVQARWHGGTLTTHWVAAGVDWARRAALGLALAEHLGVQPVPSDPGLAWRGVGRVLREGIQRGQLESWLLKRLPSPPVASQSTPWHGEDRTGAVGLASKVMRRHRARSWIHVADVRVWELLHDTRVDKGALDRLLESEGLPSCDRGGSGVKAHRLSKVRLSAIRSAGHATTDEASTRSALAKALGSAPSWDAVEDAARRCFWHRHRIPKVAGGYRWLEVPEESLKLALRLIQDLLQATVPDQRTATAFRPGASPTLHAMAHAGARSAVRMDIRDFFGSVRPRHLAPWFGSPENPRCLLPLWSHEGLRAIMSLLFRTDASGRRHLPQGAPSSPVAANLAAFWLDGMVVREACRRFGRGRFVYTRYADDLVVSTSLPRPTFHNDAKSVLTRAVEAQGWRVNTAKTRTWSAADGYPLEICGIWVPRFPGDRASLARPPWRRAKSALHHLRHRDFFDGSDPDRARRLLRAHGLMAYAYQATGDLRWLAYTSGLVTQVARMLAGPLFCESVLAGWSDESLAQGCEPE